MIPTTLVAATGNLHKVDELRSLFAQNGLKIHIVPITDFVNAFDVDETGTTFEENAFIKAVAGYNTCMLPVIADDSGLEVEALGNSPGVYSARYSGANATDASNRSKLLNALTSETNRNARFRCVLALYDGARTLLAEGTCHGTIAPEERGEHGFGYDSLFIPTGLDDTFGQVQSHVKHQRSHRAFAVVNLVSQLRATEACEVETTPSFLVRASIAIAVGNQQMLADAIASIRTQEHYRCMYETILQSYLFCGFPAALEGLVLLDTMARQQGLKPETELHERYSVPDFRVRGEHLCRTIYGTVYDRMTQRLSEVSPEMSEWMIVEGYGKTLSRPSMNIIDRECCIVAILACTGKTTQLVSHVRGALAVGATVEHLHAVIDAIRASGMADAALLLDNVLGRFE
jgi:XTP/dITP diphosphohydrolase